MQDRLLKQASREYSPRQRAAVLIAAGVLFVIILPIAILRLGRRLDRFLGWAPRRRPANIILGVLMAVTGWLLGVWSVYVQFTLGRGTPVPLVATQKLIVGPPYSYCRNPMALGAILAYLGLSLAAGSLGSALVVLWGAVKLLVYIRFAEEREMVARFGEEYLAYRRRVPFLIPRLPWRG